LHYATSTIIQKEPAFVKNKIAEAWYHTVYGWARVKAALAHMAHEIALHPFSFLHVHFFFGAVIYVYRFARQPPLPQYQNAETFMVQIEFR